MADGLSKQYADLLTGSYDCSVLSTLAPVDRIVLNAHFRALAGIGEIGLHLPAKCGGVRAEAVEQIRGAGHWRGVDCLEYIVDLLPLFWSHLWRGASHHTGHAGGGQHTVPA